MVGGGYAAYAAGADDASYRTVVATTGDVQETLDVSGTVEPVGRADLSFATSGTVATIGVEAGDHVQQGQVLGALETTSLRNAVRQARSALASARAQLESDEDAQTSTVSSASASSAPTGPVTGGPDRRPAQEPTVRPPSRRRHPDGRADGHADPRRWRVGRPRRGAGPARGRAGRGHQRAVDGQRVARGGQRRARRPAGGLRDGVHTGTPPATTLARAPGRGSRTRKRRVHRGAHHRADRPDPGRDRPAGPAGRAGGAGRHAHRRRRGPPVVVLWWDAPSRRHPDGRSRPSSVRQPTEQAQPTQQAPQTQAAKPSSSDTTQQSGSSGATVSAATLAHDQATIDQAKADLITAQDELKMATVTAPFSGRIVAVDAAVGDSVASGTEVFVLVSQGTTTVEVAATSTQVQQLAVGQRRRRPRPVRTRRWPAPSPRSAPSPTTTRRTRSRSR